MSFARRGVASFLEGRLETRPLRGVSTDLDALVGDAFILAFAGVAFGLGGEGAML